MIEWMLTLHIVIFLTITPMAIIVNRKLYHNIKNEEHRENGKVIQRILKTYSVVQCTLPVICYCLMILNLAVESVEKLGPMLKFFLLHLTRCLMHFYVIYTATHSLIIALGRYMFLVFERKADEIGIRKLKHFFVGSSLGLPIGLTLLHNLVISTEEFREREVLFSFQNISISTNDTIKGCMGGMFHTMENPLYCFIEENFNPTLITIVRIVLISTNTIILSNLVEAFIYIHTYTYIIR